ncbi:MAG: efflux RND transporter periplasmic adaptor subunit [Woeseiaceae bacterium]|nr:efflux RND transporter periplasmic adaptor subunit [Woeseiaceae bacterium]
MSFNQAATTAALFLLLAACSQSTNESDGTEDEAEAAIPVEITRVARGDIESTYSGTAPIEAYAEATVIAKVGGEVREILAEEGDAVRAGQVLARLDGERLRLELAQSEANLQKLRRDYQRNRDLKDRSLISAGDFEKIQYEMEALEASYNLARLELSYTEIKAPIDGVISERFVKTGNTIDVNAPVFHVTSLDPLIAELHIPERQYRRLSPGMPATVRVDALSGVTFSGEIARVSPVVDPDTGTFKITVEVTDPTQRLKPGMFARIGIVSDRHANALQVPRSAIIEDEGISTVFVAGDGTAERRAVRTGYVADGQIEVVEGLTDEDRIVIVGQAGLRDGARIEIVNSPTNEISSVAIGDAVAIDET